MSAPVPINKLKAAMQGMSGVPTTPTPLPAAADAVVHKPAAPLAPSRQGKRSLSHYINALAVKQFRALATDLDKSGQALMEEALNDLFRKYNKSAIA